MVPVDARVALALRQAAPLRLLGERQIPESCSLRATTHIRGALNCLSQCEHVAVRISQLSGSSEAKERATCAP